MISMADHEPLVQDCWQQLATIDDPEMPINIVDLGMIVALRLESHRLLVQLTPTYTGCTALPMIDDLIRQRLAKVVIDRPVEVEHVFDPPWTAARISTAGKERLRQHGVTVGDPQRVQLQIAGRDLVSCPYCQSTDTYLDSPFGPTRCRTIHYCRHCRNSFEQIKSAV
ncbi:MAG: putative 1,2-phenylacetyl-CoA epoxidase, subunit D [Phycisphaerae bacterium]|nr:putative 1,2-phenylacetyl-CoA epoxidase, subunit D [Phycisphaerae bacterium]